ncbi:MAG: thermonuclease family protein [Candidatus Kapaibacterium sp.]
MGRFLFVLFFLILPALSLQAQVGELVEVDSLLSPLLIRLADGRVVRLIGIDLPTSTSASDCREHLRHLIGINSVTLVADTILLDQSSDTLERYVYVGSVMLNQQMIADGYALPTAVSHSHHDEFQTLNAAHQASGEVRERSESKLRETSSESKASSSSSSTSTSVQCSGRTKKGAQCKRMTTNPSGKCWQHE